MLSHYRKRLKSVTMLPNWRSMLPCCLTTEKGCYVVLSQVATLLFLYCLTVEEYGHIVLVGCPCFLIQCFATFLRCPVWTSSGSLKLISYREKDALVDANPGNVIISLNMKRLKC